MKPAFSDMELDCRYTEQRVLDQVCSRVSANMDSSERSGLTTRVSLSKKVYLNISFLWLAKALCIAMTLCHNVFATVGDYSAGLIRFSFGMISYFQVYP